MLLNQNELSEDIFIEKNYTPLLPRVSKHSKLRFDIETYEKKYDFLLDPEFDFWVEKENN